MFEDVEEKFKPKKAKIQNNVETTTVIEQQSDEWYLARLGKFTGSRIPDLMKSGRGGKGIGAAALTYIMEKLNERMLSEEGKLEHIAKQALASGRPAQWGIDNEAWARGEFEKIIGKKVIETEFKDHKVIDTFGGSSDGEIVGTNDIVEIKNPYDGAKHIKNMIMCNGGEYPENGDYYGQMQANIAVADADGCYFISGDKRCEIPIAYVYVPRNQDYIDNVYSRIFEAEDIINDYLKQLEK